MKRLVSVLCVLMLIVGMIAVCGVSTSAAESAKTTLDVKKGDEVTYKLTLSDVPTPVIGLDFSFYYDSSLFEVVSVADYTGSTDEGDWKYMMNPDLDGEVIGNFSNYPKNLDFSTAHDFLTVNMKAIGDGTGHLSYFVRYMYDDSLFPPEGETVTQEQMRKRTQDAQISTYKFTCDVTKNGELVIEKAEPELNIEETQKTGVFVNSVTGDSKDADPDNPKTVAKPEALVSGGSGSGSDNGSGSGSGSGSDSNNGAAADAKSADAAAANAEDPQNSQLGTDAQGNYILATDAEGNVTATSDTAPAKSGGSSAWIWIVIILLVVAGGGAGIFYSMNKKKAAANADNTAKDAVKDAAKDETKDTTENK